MKKELEVNENLDVLFEELEEKDEFALRAPASIVSDGDDNEPAGSYTRGYC